MNRGGLAGCGLAVCVTALGLVSAAGTAAGRPAAPPSGSWSAPLALVPAGEPTHALRLAVGADGEVSAAWVQGEYDCDAVPPLPADAHSASATAEKIVVDRGSILGGFGSPVILDGPTQACASAEPPFVAIAGTGVAYAAWKGETSLAPWMISAAPAGRAFSVAHELASPYRQLLALLQSPNGPVAAVWLRAHGPGSPGEPPPLYLEYALLRTEGSLGKVVDVGPLEIGDVQNQLALNDAGEFAAVGLDQRERQAVVVCDPAGKCGWRLPYLGGAGDRVTTRDAIALSEDGTVSVLAGHCTLPAAESSEGRCVRPDGVWTAVRTGDGHWLRSRELSAAASASPLLTGPFGQGGALALLDEGRGEGHMSLAWASLRSGAQRFARPVAADARASSAESELALDQAGDYVLAGVTAAAERGCCELAISGRVDSAPGAQLLTGRDEPAKEVQVGIDAAGDGIALWNEGIGRGFGQTIMISTLHG
jgi:hypothetical protein